jgi:hypothetical protein
LPRRIIPVKVEAYLAPKVQVSVEILEADAPPAPVDVQVEVVGAPEVFEPLDLSLSARLCPRASVSVTLDTLPWLLKMDEGYLLFGDLALAEAYADEPILN